MALLKKTRGNDRLIAEAAKERAALGAHVAKASAAKADYDRALEAGDAEAMVSAKALYEACEALIVRQRAIVDECERRVAAALEADDVEAKRRYLAELDERARRKAEALTKIATKALAPALALLNDLAGDAAEHAEANKIAESLGLPPILTAEERARTIPGRVEPAVWEDRVVWRKYAGGPEVSLFRRDSSGELVPQEAGAVRSIERVCVRSEREIASRRPKSLIETVVIPSFSPDDASPMWPPKEGAC